MARLNEIMPRKCRNHAKPIPAASLAYCAIDRGPEILLVLASPVTMRHNMRTVSLVASHVSVNAAGIAAKGL